ncbi:hypothetical protein [Inquilinus sp. CA228]|uniref:hypothetical protein n=1 Tax=Inquilinus sp. CA228 TaxID=3455609 RepID=UPI003F8D6F11
MQKFSFFKKVAFPGFFVFAVSGFVLRTAKDLSVLPDWLFFLFVDPAASVIEFLGAVGLLVLSVSLYREADDVAAAYKLSRKFVHRYSVFMVVVSAASMALVLLSYVPMVV